MARDIIDILARVEAHYPQAVGGTSRDDILRSSLVGFANDTIGEIDRERRWSLSYSEFTAGTSAGDQVYPLTVPSLGNSFGGFDYDRIKRVYYLDANGKIQMLERMEREELQRLYADNTTGIANLPRGKPVKYAIEATNADGAGFDTVGSIKVGAGDVNGNIAWFPYTMFLYPIPDDQGPTPITGSYPIRVGGYFNTPLIVETTATVSSSSTAVTVPSTDYLKKNQVPTNGSQQGSTMSIRNAGNTKISGTVDQHISSWSAFPSATGVTATFAVPTGVTAQQAFFHSTNWIIRYWPKVILFGMLREVASYYGNDQDFLRWQSRYSEQLEKLSAWEFDRGRGLDQFAVAQVGQRAGSLQRNDATNYYDVRGGSAS